MKVNGSTSHLPHSNFQHQRTSSSSLRHGLAIALLSPSLSLSLSTMPILIPCFTCFGDQNPVRDGVAGALQGKVGELFSLLWDWSLGWPTNLILLGRNAELLDREMEELKELRDDMKRRVESEEAQPSMERMRRVGGWLAGVSQLETHVSDFRAALERQSLCITGLCLGRTAVERLKRVRDLKAQLSAFDAVVSTAAPDAGTLEEEMEELRTMRDGLMRKVENEEAADPQMKRIPAVTKWLEKVAALEDEVAELLRSPAGITTGRVAEKLRRLRKVKSEWKFDGEEVVTRVLPDAVEEVHSKPVSSIVGNEETLFKIRGHLRDPGVAIIGVWGMGGIGKTTLLKQINNELSANGVHGGMFKVVVLVTVSRDRSILAIQRAIGERIGLPLAEDEGGTGNPARLVKQQSNKLHISLSQRRFLLLLDDVWERLDLELVGIPFPSPDNGCKIVLATRSEEVCIDMDAQATVKVNPLDGAQSWELFRKTVHADAVLDDPSIRPLAEKVVTQCGGLPLALLTVGRAMANKKLPSQWRNAVKALQDSSQELRGMEKEVLKELKFSFDWLPSDTLRCCLLYCALFPEDHEIDRGQLVEYWIGEGYVASAADAEEDNDEDAMARARDSGQDLITTLQAACLLESGISDETNRVKLHDTVRDMALWLTGGSVQGWTDTFLVHAGWGPEAPLPGTARWVKATKISFMCNTNLILPNSVPDCPMVTTLLANGNPYTAGVSDELFSSLPMLGVLDLSQARIYGLPASIGSLVHLRYLNISLTRMVSLPKELGTLVNLRQLVMRKTSYLLNIPVEAFCPLTRLRSLDMYCSNYAWSWEHNGGQGAGEQQGGVCLKDLESMEGLGELGLNITTLASLNGLLNSRRFTRSMKLLSLSVVDGLTPAKLQAALSSMKTLQALQLNCCAQLEELHFGGGRTQSLESLVLDYLPLTRVVADGGDSALLCLQRLELKGCHSLRHITWAGHLPCLKSIDVIYCNSIEELVAAGEDGTGDEMDGSVFPKLRTMDLRMLPLLRSMAPRQLLLPSLDSLKVYDCPVLKKLPLGVDSAGRMRLIRGEQEWWEALDWEDPAIKRRFIPHFVDPSQ